MKKTQPETPELCITGLGLVTSVGHDHITACASIRAGFARPKKLDNFYAEPKVMYEDPDDGLINGHPVFEGDLDRTCDRMVSLLVLALDDLKQSAGFKGNRPPGICIYVALPESDRLASMEGDIRDRILELCEKSVPEARVAVYPNGHAGMVLALSDAAGAIHDGRCEAALIAGVDSLVGYDDLMRFENQGRLKTILNSDGFMPGEAASALLVESRRSAERRKAPVSCVIRAISTAREERTVLAGNPTDGTGLTRAIAGLAGRMKDGSLNADAVITDLNGEPYRFHEWAMIQSRIMVKIGGEKNLICPVRNIGDTGAAGPGAALCIAARAIARGYLAADTENPSPQALILSSSDTGERGAVLIGPYEV